MLHVSIPGGEDLDLEHLVMDLNGTLSNRGGLIEGVAEQLAELRSALALQSCRRTRSGRRRRSPPTSAPGSAAWKPAMTASKTAPARRRRK